MNKISRKNGARVLNVLEQQKLDDWINNSKALLKEQYPWKCDKEITKMINSSLKTALCMPTYEKMIAHLRAMQINSISREEAAFLWEKKWECRDKLQFNHKN